MSESIIRLEGREGVSEGGMCVAHNVGECRVTGDQWNPDTQEKYIGEGVAVVHNVHVVYVVHDVCVVHAVPLAQVVHVFLGVVVHVVEGVWGGGTWG